MATVDVEFSGAASAERLSRAVDGLKEGINSLGDNTALTAQAILELVDRLEAAAAQVISLTAESEALERNAQRLGLDFNEAADAAGRFTDETDVMTTAARFAEAGIRLTQEELNNLTRAGAQFSQNTGQPMAAVMQQIADGTLNGTEALRRFGPEMAALQGPAHTVNERLAAMVRHAQALPQATDDAASSLERLRDTFGDAQREMARGFSEQIGQALELGSVVRALGGDLNDTTDTMRAIGRAAADVVSAVVNTVATVVSVVAIAGTAVNDALHGRGFAGGEDSRQMYALFLSRANAVTSAVDRLSNGGDSGAPSAPATTSAAGASMTFTADEARAIEGDATARNQRGGAGGSRAAGSSLEDLMGRAFANRQALGALAVPGEADAIAAAAAEEDKQKRAREAAAREAEEARAAGDRAVAERSRQTDVIVGLFEREHDAALSLRDALVGTYDAATEALGTYLGALLSGEEASAQAVLTAIDRKAQQVAGESAIQALQATAEGIYYSFTAPPIAATKFLAAAKFGALALGAGATAAVIPNAPAAGGGGGRGGAGGVTPARLDPARESGGGPTIVNINVTSGVASTPRDTARAVRRVLGDGAALTGIGLPANVLGGL